jgi:hypothetical protein
MSEGGDQRRLTPEETARRERQAQAVKLRNGGSRYSDIARELGVSEATVAEDITNHLARMARPEAEHLIGRQRQIMDDIIAANYQSMLLGDDKAAKTILTAVAHEAKLMGLYAPERVQIGVSHENFAVTAVQLMERLGITPPEAIASSVPRELHGVIDAEVVTDENTDDQGMDTWVMG